MRAEQNRPSLKHKEKRLKKHKTANAGRMMTKNLFFSKLS